MIFNQSKKEKIAIIIIHASLIMYGDAFVRIDKRANNAHINWLALSDGGNLIDQGEKDFSSCVFGRIIDIIYGVNFPDQENDSSSIRWELQCGSNSEELIDSIEFGLWGVSTLNEIIEQIKILLNDSGAIQCLQRLVNA